MGRQDAEASRQIREVVRDADGATVKIGADNITADGGTMTMIIGPTPLLLLVDTMVVLLAITAEMGAAAIRVRALVLFADPLST